MERINEIRQRFLSNEQQMGNNVCEGVSIKYIQYATTKKSKL